MEAGPSRTAMLAAITRAQHRLEDAPPWVFDDPFAQDLVGPGWPELMALLDALFPKQLQRQARAAVAARSRYAEDRLKEGAFTQYVILGAGLDSFAWRRPDLLGPLRVFEIDHPASQEWKRQRATELGLPAADGHVFASVDFEVESLAGGLDAADFSWNEPTLFCWLGVMMYLTADAIEQTMRTIARCARGSEVVFSYRADDSALDEDGRALIGILEPLAAQLGEPFTEGRTPLEMESLVNACGLHTEDHPTHTDLIERYFATRTDALTPWTPERLATARVP